MTRLVHISAFACLVAAAIQAIAVIDRVLHAATLAIKVGPDAPLITAGTTMIFIFFAFSATAVGLAILTGDTLRKKKSSIGVMASVSAWSLTGGSFLWAAMIASPYVVVIAR